MIHPKSKNCNDTLILKYDVFLGIETPESKPANRAPVPKVMMDLPCSAPRLGGKNMSCEALKIAGSSKNIKDGLSRFSNFKKINLPFSMVSINLRFSIFFNFAFQSIFRNFCC